MTEKISSNHLPPQDFLNALNGSDMDDDSGVKVGNSKTTCNFVSNHEEFTRVGVSPHLSRRARVRNYMCGFPLDEERKKRKTFFSHTAGSLGTGVRRFSDHVACVRFQFLFCHPPFPDMSRPPTREELVDCV